MNSDEIHKITLLPVIKKHIKLYRAWRNRPADHVTRLIDPEITLLHKALKDYSEMELDYLEYLFNAYEEPEKRDYSKLVSVLERNVNTCAGLYCRFESVLWGKTISKIVDVGFGHAGYYSILRKLYPLAQYIAIDKREIEDPNITAGDFSLVNADIFEWVKDFHGDPNTLIFMSEFLHCKEKNLEILSNLEIRKCMIVINELSYDPFINYRFSLSGGRCIAESELIDILGSSNCTFFDYSNMFAYYLLGYYNYKGT